VTAAAAAIDLAQLPGLTWNSDGTVGLSGPLLSLFERLDAAFVSIARAFEAEPNQFVPILSAQDLRAIDYFSSFPHLVTLPVSLDRDPANLTAFSQANAGVEPGPLTLGKLQPTGAVLAPAACYAVYPSLRGLDATRPRNLTVLGTCFRREEHYLPLRRQWCFRMREVVHVGSGESAQAFLADGERRVRELASSLDLPLTTAAATDPFFDPARSARYLHQKLFPTKHELIFEGSLAIGSFNYHRNFFGEAFGLRCGGQAAHTGCVAFGVERWVWAILSRHGVDPRGWPSLVQEKA
jgi:seryl-tRNA synthetase